MTKDRRPQPRKFLKDLGFFFDLKPAQLDRKFLKLLAPEDQETVERVWAAASVGLDISAQLYSVPKTIEQATALFSHDADRYLASLAWIAGVVDATRPSSVIDMGCGAGLLLKFLRERDSTIHVNGIDTAKNLVRIGSELLEQRLLDGDYLNYEPNSQYDLVVCEFGYDNSSIPASRKPHSSAKCGPASYCPGCAEDAQSHFQECMKAWRKWSGQSGALALTGRMTDYTDVRAVTMAAKDQGWFVDLSRSKVLATIDRYNRKQFFPAWYFTTDEDKSAKDEEIAAFYVQRGRSKPE